MNEQLKERGIQAAMLAFNMSRQAAERFVDNPFSFTLTTLPDEPWNLSDKELEELIISVQKDADNYRRAEIALRKIRAERMEKQ